MKFRYPPFFRNDPLSPSWRDVCKHAKSPRSWGEMAKVRRPKKRDEHCDTSTTTPCSVTPGWHHQRGTPQCQHDGWSHVPRLFRRWISECQPGVHVQPCPREQHRHCSHLRPVAVPGQESQSKVDGHPEPETGTDVRPDVFEGPKLLLGAQAWVSNKCHGVLSTDCVEIPPDPVRTFTQLSQEDTDGPHLALACTPEPGRGDKRWCIETSQQAAVAMWGVSESWKNNITSTIKILYHRPILAFVITRALLFGKRGTSLPNNEPSSHIRPFLLTYNKSLLCIVRHSSLFASSELSYYEFLSFVISSYAKDWFPPSAICATQLRWL